MATCMDRATLTLLQNNLTKLDKLTQAQRDSIVAALEAYDFGADAAGAKFRDDLVAAIKKGDTDMLSFAMTLTMGTVTFKACP